MRELDLQTLTDGSSVRNLSGYERGVAARVLFHLDELDREAEPVRVVVPREVYTLTPSFFQGMFSESVRALGGDRSAFLAHYRFDASAVVMRQIDRGIETSSMRRGHLLAN